VRAASTRALLCIIGVGLCGCAAPLPPVVKESLKCEIPAAMLERCAEPTQIQEGVTFKEIIQIMLQDRDNLRNCAQRQESLAGAATLCQTEVAKYNQEVQQSNARNAKQ
jgi:hypothetical protein